MKITSVRRYRFVLGLAIGTGLGGVWRATAQQPAPPPPPGPARYQISVADPKTIYVLEHDTSVVYTFGLNPQGVWEASPGFGIPQEIQKIQKRNPIQRLDPK